MKKVLFISGTRADYGKLKPLMRAVEESDNLINDIFVSGMHLSARHGHTYKEILKDGYSNVHVAFGLLQSGKMSYDLGNLICNLSGYVMNTNPDLIVVHGDRIDALAGAAVGALTNTRVAHVEGGELSGTVDESIRHTISKLAHIHFVCNEEAAKRLRQMGEEESRIYVIGSPDLDIMLSDELPSLDEAKKRYGIDFNHYSIVLYHPVTTEYERVSEHARVLVSALIQSEMNYIVILPNNDTGYDLITGAYQELLTKANRKRFKLFPSIRFEFFITLLANSDFIIGNSSAGVREACVYGIPAIDIGTRQQGRYIKNAFPNIIHVDDSEAEIAEAILQAESIKKEPFSAFGRGNSSQLFMKALEGPVWDIPIQKKFIDC